MSPEASVVVCTYNRPQMLRRTLESCLADATRRGTSYEVVVADNSPGGYARALCAELATPAVPVRWVPCAPPNISVARNAGLRAAAAPVVAFLDDDLRVEAGWLDHLLATLESTGADVVLGPVRPDFGPGGAPAWDPGGARYTRDLGAPDGTPVVVAGPGRTPGLTVSTASSAWRATCFTDPEPFSPALGASGGEDLDLMWRLERRGARFAWSPGAGVREEVPPGRIRLRYQLLRAFSGGQVYLAVAARNSDRPRVTAARGMVRALVQLLLTLPALVTAPPRGRAALARAALTVAGAVGKLAWARLVPLYHVEASTEADPAGVAGGARVAQVARGEDS